MNEMINFDVNLPNVNLHQFKAESLEPILLISRTGTICYMAGAICERAEYDAGWAEFVAE